jgi:hypothetical protein
MVLRALLTWLPMLPLAIANGFAREVWLAEKMGALHAHQLSTATCTALFLVYMYLLDLFFPLPSVGAALKIGGIWLGLTVAFEFLFGRYAGGHSWRHLLADYNIFAGRVWVLVLLTVMFGPALIVLIRS